VIRHSWDRAGITELQLFRSCSRETAHFQRSFPSKQCLKSHS